jgi:hypothetical protein
VSPLNRKEESVETLANLDGTIMQEVEVSLLSAVAGFFFALLLQAAKEVIIKKKEIYFIDFIDYYK